MERRYSRATTLLMSTLAKALTKAPNSDGGSQWIDMEKHGDFDFEAQLTDQDHLL